MDQQQNSQDIIYNHSVVPINFDNVEYRNVNDTMYAISYDAPRQPACKCNHNQAPTAVEEGAKSVEPLLGNLSKLLVSGAQSDFVIVANKVEFKVHKCILVMHSTVLATMIERSQASKQTMSGFDTDTIQDFIHYLYNGEVKNKETAMSLYKLADRYDIEDLKAISEEMILRNITDSNAIDVFTFGYVHSAEKLTFKAFSHFRKMFPTESLTGMLSDPTKLVQFVHDKINQK